MGRVAVAGASGFRAVQRLALTQRCYTLSPLQQGLGVLRLAVDSCRMAKTFKCTSQGLGPKALLGNMLEYSFELISLCSGGKEFADPCALRTRET